MAELLVKRLDTTSLDIAKDAQLYKRGDVVVVKPNGFSWGSLETLPDFFRVNITDVTVSQTLKYLNPERSAVIIDGKGDYIIVRRRLWRILVDNVPARIRQDLIDTGETTVTWAQIRSYVQNKATLATE